MDNAAEKGTHILMTGATGFLGVPLSHRLLAAGYRLAVVARNPESAQRKLGAAVRVVGQLSDLPVLHYRAVINLAGEPLAAGRWNDLRKAHFRTSRIDTTKALFAHFQHIGRFPDVLVSGSAVGVYGEGGDSVLTENSPVGNGFAAELCRDWEEAATAFAEVGTRVCLLRTGMVLGSDGGALAKMLPAFRLGAGGRMGSGNQWMSWIHRQDWLGLALRCLDDKRLSGPINLVAPKPVTNAEFTRALGAVLHRPTLIPMPTGILRLAFGEMADALLLVSQRVVPERAMGGGYQFAFPELTLALEDILKK